MAEDSNGQAKAEENVATGEQSTPTEPAKSSEYIKELIKEKNILDPTQHPHAMRLIDEEMAEAQTKGKNVKDGKFVDIYREKPVRIVVKVLVPVKEHPRFNFVGKLLGPKGNSLKRLQEETMTRMAILGRGSMRDKQKEEECRSALDPKYAHLNDELHVEVVALAAPAEAHARIAFALAELRKCLVPDSGDDIRMEQMREMQVEGGGWGRGGGGRGRGPPPPPRPPPPPPPPQQGGGRGPPMGGGGAPPLLPRPTQGKTKVLSILERARVAMEETSYQDDDYYDSPPAPGYGYGGDYNGGAGDYYDTGYAAEPAPGRWKGYKSGGGGGGRFGNSRNAPYSRPSK